jgi:general secretion pathway protein L
LIACVPVRWREALAIDAKSTVLRLTLDTLELCEVRRANAGTPGREHVIAKGNLAAVMAEFREGRRFLARVTPTYLRVPQSQCLVRHVAVPVVGLRRLHSILALDLERSTPFLRSDVFSGAILPEGDRGGAPSVQVTHVVFKASYVEPLLQALSSAGIPCAGIEVEGRGGEVLPVRLGREGEAANTVPPLLARLKRASLILAAALGLIATATVALNAHTKGQVLTALRTENTALQKRAAVARQRLTEAQTAETETASLRLRKLEGVGLLQLIEELSRTLPDDVWVSELQLSGSEVTIDGQARAAAELIGVLSRNPHIREASFAAPVTRDPSKGVERFRIRFKVHSGRDGRG